MKIQSKALAVNTLTLAVAMGMATMAQANGSNTEVEQLRGEVKELRALLEQYVAAKPAVSMPAPGTPAQNYPAPAAAPKANGLSFTTPSGTEVKFYGNIRADVAYQAEGGSTTRMYNQISSVPLNNEVGVTEASDRLKTTLNSSRFGFDFKTPTQAGDVAGKLEMDFVGGASTADQFRIRHAYMTYGNWLVGQTWSNFAITDYMPETIDALGYVGGAVKRTPQVRYTKTVNPNTNFAVAIEDSKYSDTVDPGNEMRLPVLTARLNQKFANGAGIITPRVMVTEKKTASDEITAWGAGLGMKYNLTPSTTLKADYYHVKGDSSFVSWSNPSYVVETDGDMVENEFDSITVGLTQQFTPKWRGTLGYGYMKMDDNKEYQLANGTTDTKKNAINENLWQGWANVFYSPVKPLSFGLEYVYGERETFEGKTGEDNRVQATAIYNF
ncbi:DcaP family trimeric outer membrane transporter [Acinetobacter sp. CAAS 2-6]|uniref:DcaP family trimeric outer membrane transporter n=1 Tax=Acinetobacter sp. CAAS 2-6 TaxID=3016358 RepID=UPI003FA3C87B